MQLQWKEGSLRQHVQEHVDRTSLISRAAASNGKKIDKFALCVVRNESETSERSNDGQMTVRGVVEGLGNGEDLRFGLVV